MPDEIRRDGYVSAPGYFLLNQACQTIRLAFGMPYLVGSATQTKAYRDVDVRVILDDQTFAGLFPDGGRRLDARWSLVCSLISQHLSAASGLPVDFQIQSQTHANERYAGLTRIPLGIYPTTTAGGGS